MKIQIPIGEFIFVTLLVLFADFFPGFLPGFRTFDAAGAEAPVDQIASRRLSETYVPIEVERVILELALHPCAIKAWARFLLWNRMVVLENALALPALFQLRPMNQVSLALRLNDKLLDSLDKFDRQLVNVAVCSISESIAQA